MLSYITVYTFYMLTSIDTIKIVLDKFFFISNFDSVDTVKEYFKFWTNFDEIAFHPIFLQTLIGKQQIRVQCRVDISCKIFLKCCVLTIG